MSRAPLLFQPARIGPLEIRNRVVMSPMTTGYATADGLPSERLVAYLEARARGGVGLITLEACTIDRRHREVPRSMHFSDDGVIALHRELVERMHAHGAAVQPQIVHPGPDGLAPFLEKIPSLGPSVIPSYLTGVPSRALEVEEIPPIVERYAQAARRVREAGYDGLELHAAHGYMLLGSFLSPWRNKRQDEYAGHLAAGRIKLICEVLHAIKRAAGADFPITLRISGYERVAGGRDIADTQRIAPLLAAAGVDAFHVSGGVIDRLTSQIVTGSHYADAHNAAAAAAVRSVVDVPVMAVGRIHDPAVAESVLSRGQADFVVMGRPLLADPDFVNKAKAAGVRAFAPKRAAADAVAATGIRRCISCQNCIDSMEVGRMACAVNAFTGRELDFSLAPVSDRKRVLVIGGGPAGLEAARVAATRGHRVTLIERERQLGGALILAAAVHPENEPLLSWLVAQVARLPIDVRLGESASAETARTLGCDAAVVATGGRVVTPPVPGDHLRHVVRAADLRAAFSAHADPSGGTSLPAWQRAGLRALSPAVSRWLTPQRIRRLSKRWLPFGQRIAIVGSDLAAVELAEFLALHGRSVHLFGQGPEIAPEVGLKRRTEHMDRLDRLAVAVHMEVEIRRIDARGLEVVRAAGAADDAAGAVPARSTAAGRDAGDASGRRVGVDHVILAGELRPDLALAHALRAQLADEVTVQPIGDCTGLGLIRKAIAEAAQVATAL